MRLCEVPRKSYVRLVPDEQPEGTRVPPAAPSIEEGEVLLFHHIDGMYSLCHNEAGQICHLVAWAEVEVVDPPAWADPA